MVGVECWDEMRDARTYGGPYPVVAHPPCGAWGAMRFVNKYQDASGGPAAVDAVRRWGGVLEQPKGSLLWAHCGLPLPGEFPDASGGIAIEVAQVDWGHPARKRTWLYFVGCRPFGPYPHPREPTHWCWGTHAPGQKSTMPAGVKAASAQQRRRTPPAFAEWLVSIARSVKRRAA
jgi:hypothetical protein